MNTLRIAMLIMVLVFGVSALNSQDYSLRKYSTANSGAIHGFADGFYMQGNFGQSIVGQVTDGGDRIQFGYWSELDLGFLSVENKGSNPADRKIKNFPNPFRDYTDFRFELEGAANVSLKIYDMNGSMVNEVFRGYLGTGEHSINWNGYRGDGQLAATGTYLYELSVEPMGGSAMYSKGYTLRNTMVIAR